MKKKILQVVSVTLCLVMLLSGPSASAEQSGFMKVLYNSLNTVVEGLVSAICAIYPNPPEWMDIDDYNSEEAGFLPGRETYQTQAGENNQWELGYASRSLVPDDIDSGKYNLGRDLMNKYAQGVYDDQRIRVVVIDDNSGEGAVIWGSVDAMGVTSTDTRTIRKAVLDYCEEQGIDVASINISATHAHSALDTQGVSTEFFRKLIGNFWWNLLGLESSLPGLEPQTASSSSLLTNQFRQ